MSELSPEQISKLTTKVIEEGYSLTRSECLLVLEALAEATTRAERAEADWTREFNLVTILQAQLTTAREEAV